MQHKFTALILLASCAGVIAATTFSGNFLVRATWDYDKTVGASTIEQTFGDLLFQSHTSGTGTNQMNAVIVYDDELTNSASVTYNLNGGVVDSFGDNIAFTQIRWFMLHSDSSSNSNFTVGNASTNQFSSWLGATNHTVTVAPSGILLFTAPNVGFASANGWLKITNTGTNTSTYVLYVGGIK